MWKKWLSDCTLLMPEIGYNEDATNEGIKRLMPAICGQMRQDVATAERDALFMHLSFSSENSESDSSFASAHFVNSENQDWC